MDQSVYDIIKVYLAQMESAIKISETISKHSNREDVNGDDIICGLVYRLMRPMTKIEIDESLNKAETILNDEYDSDDNDDENIIENYEIPKISRKINSNHCNCEICCDVRVCLLNYHNHEPNDTLSQRFKNSIEETCKKHRIYI